MALSKYSAIPAGVSAAPHPAMRVDRIELPDEFGLCVLRSEEVAANGMSIDVAAGDWRNGCAAAIPAAIVGYDRARRRTAVLAGKSNSALRRILAIRPARSYVPVLKGRPSARMSLVCAIAASAEVLNPRADLRIDPRRAGW
jgi:hypothetical protein